MPQNNEQLLSELVSSHSSYLTKSLLVTSSIKLISGRALYFGIVE